MVFSVRANKKRIFAALVVVAVVILGMIVLPKLIKEPVKFYGETAAERREFLESFGWQISEEPLDVREVMIPEQWNDVYTKYNEMQISQGFDIRPYKGKACRQYIYLVNNYPDTDSEIHATMLVYNGVIIGGDISSAEVDGFMHGFAADSEHYGGGASAESAVSMIPESSEPISSEPGQTESAESTAAEPEGEAADAEITEDAYPTD